MIDNEILVAIDFLDYQENPERLIFRSPCEVIEARSVTEVTAAIEAIEDASARGYYAAGFISYEAAPAFDSALKVKESSGFPLVWFGVFDQASAAAPITAQSEFTDVQWEPETSKSRYDDAIASIHCSIEKGESYQTNYTLRLRSHLSGDLFAYYERLRESHPCPYSAYIDTGAVTVISNSPELYLSVNDGHIVSQPMKGTIPRGRNLAEDKLLKERLAASEKDRAEHVMIVDLMRSDLGKVAKIGSVRVENSFGLLRLPTVWQMISTVTCERRNNVTLLEILKASFPPGSVTGAPKAQTMEIIRTHEISARKAYCGAVGFVKPGGDAVFNVPIRTIVVDNLTGYAECGIGGGITAGSVASDEYAEAIAKSRFLSAKPQDFDLLESMLLKDGDYFLLDEHLCRLGQAAEYFDFSADIKTVRQALIDFSQSNGNGAWKVRLTVDKTGRSHITSTAIEESGPKKVSLASRPILVHTPFVFHKTTRREMYDELKQENADAYDVLLWNEKGEITEFTSGNVVVELDSVQYTPPVTCGLLAGTFRDYLLRSGDIYERTITTTDLGRATRIWFINSVRRRVPVTLVDNYSDSSREIASPLVIA